jgi:hypothetical protein
MEAEANGLFKNTGGKSPLSLFVKGNKRFKGRPKTRVQYQFQRGPGQ